MAFSINFSPDERASLGNAAQRAGKTPHALARALVLDGVRRVLVGAPAGEGPPDPRIEVIASHIGMLEGWLLDELEELDAADAERAGSTLATVTAIATAWDLRDVLAACEKVRAAAQQGSQP